MRGHLLAATAFCIFACPAVAGSAAVIAQSPQSDAPVSAQDRPSEPANPLPEGETPDLRDYQALAEPGSATAPASGQAPGMPATPPGAPETPSTSPDTPASTVEPSAGGSMQSLETYLTEDGVNPPETFGERRRQLIDKPVVLPSGEQAGTIEEFVIRDGRNFAHLKLPKTPDDRERHVVASLDMLSVSPQGDRVTIKAQSRDELKDFPQYLPESYQTVR